MESTVVVLIVILVLIVVAVAAVLLYRRRSLRHRFGPEYDRVVAEHDNRSAAEQELRERERRHAELQLRPISDEARSRYGSEWAALQARFVDEPADAVRQGDELVSRLVAERGYPAGSYDDQVAHLSVEHAGTLGHYRDAHDIFLRNERGEATTEQLRQALVHYRAIFADILGEQPNASSRTDTSG
ncbi:MAG TPA: hypothetical protein VK453_27920 [Micromonosporaceae bacterium]|nr:hypothetical protein [Micromonosporaceae bacterium]